MADEHSHAIPPQHEGNQADITESIKASDKKEAHRIFLQVRERLFDINRWSDISEGLSASFVLTDRYGKPKKDIPTPGDHFRIDIPGPGSSAGSGYDWVKVEIVEDHSDPETDREWALIKVRPSEDPTKKKVLLIFLKKMPPVLL